MFRQNNKCRIRTQLGLYLEFSHIYVEIVCSFKLGLSDRIQAHSWWVFKQKKLSLKNNFWTLQCYSLLYPHVSCTLKINPAWIVRKIFSQRMDPGLWTSTISGVVKGCTGVEMSTPVFPEGDFLISQNPLENLGGGGIFIHLEHLVPSS